MHVRISSAVCPRGSTRNEAGDQTGVGLRRDQTDLQGKTTTTAGLRHHCAGSRPGAGAPVRAHPLVRGRPEQQPFIVFIAAVIVAAWFGGLWAGLLAAALSAVLSNYFFLATQYSIEIATPAQGLRLAVFVLEAAIISWLVGALHSARWWAEANALQVKKDEEDLRVRARQQQAVAELGRRALAETDLPAFMGEAVGLTAGVLDLEYCKVMELVPGGEILLLRAGVGWEEGLVERATEEVGLGSQAGYPLRSAVSSKSTAAPATELP